MLITLAAGSGDRSILGPIKGADFPHFYTLGTLARTGRTGALYDVNALHHAQVEQVPESAVDLYVPVYPPQAALLFAPFSLLSYRHAMLLWNLATILLFGIIVRSAWRRVAAHLDDAILVVAAAAAFPPFWSLVLHGQTTIVILTAFWLAWIALERNRRFAAGLALGLLLMKPQFGLPAAAVVLADGEWAMVAGALASIALQIGAVLALFGGSVLRAYIGFVPAVIVQHSDLLEPKAFLTHSLRTLTNLAPGWIGLPLWIVASAVVVVGVVQLWKSPAPLRVRFGLLMLASVLVDPHVNVYDATVLAPPLAWFGGYVQERCPPEERAAYWTSVYWLFVTLLAPTARAIGVQVSVLLMIWLLILIGRMVTGDARLQAFEHRVEPAAGVI